MMQELDIKLEYGIFAIQSFPDIEALPLLRAKHIISHHPCQWESLSCLSCQFTFCDIFGNRRTAKKKKILLKITVRNQEMGPSGGEGRKGMHVFNLCLQCLCGTCPWHSMVKRQSETLPSSRKAFTCHPGDAGQGVNPKHTGRRKTAGSVPGVFTGLSASSISVAPDSSGNLDLPQPELQLNPSVCLLQLKIVLPKSAWHFLCRQSSRI